ncbi:MAG TPA: DUF222 domain-containing protein [Gammaproteobacteria bacterium]|nr:DUF222 domain-containing protein [Gammaproteobacteria bacterium]
MTANNYAAAAAPAFAPDPRSIDDLDHAIRTLARQMNAETYRMLVLVREFDDRFGWQKWGFRNCADWLAWRCELSSSAAYEKVRTARALREMPAVSAAFEQGRLSYSKVRALARVAEYHDEAALLDYALRVSAPQLEERCREIRNSAPETSTAGAWRAWEQRSLKIVRNAARGTMKITVEMPIEDGEVIAEAIERVANAGDEATGLEFAVASKSGGVRDSADASANGWCAQQADALLAIAKTSLAGGADCTDCGAVGAHASSVADHYQVVVHVDDAVLHGGRGRSDLPVDTVHRLTCDCSVVTIVEDERGAPLDVGRKQRTVSTALKRALWSRDRGCTFPGCRNVRYVDAHHIRHWAKGGETTPENLTLLCSHHHRLVHEGGFGIRRNADDEIYFVRPDGRVIPRSGYRREDMEDDFVCADPPLSSVDRRFSSAEEWSSSAEVREPAGVYRIRAGARRRGSTQMMRCSAT